MENKKIEQIASEYADAACVDMTLDQQCFFEKAFKLGYEEALENTKHTTLMQLLDEARDIFIGGCDNIHIKNWLKRYEELKR